MGRITENLVFIYVIHLPKFTQKPKNKIQILTHLALHVSSIDVGIRRGQGARGGV